MSRSQARAGREAELNHGLWQRRHFVFFPADNVLECAVAGLSGLKKAELRVTPQFALLLPEVAENIGCV